MGGARAEGDMGRRKLTQRRTGCDEEFAHSFQGSGQAAVPGPAPPILSQVLQCKKLPTGVPIGLSAVWLSLAHNRSRLDSHPLVHWILVRVGEKMGRAWGSGGGAGKVREQRRPARGHSLFLCAQPMP